jgi:hypothetical protein
VHGAAVLVVVHGAAMLVVVHGAAVLVVVHGAAVLVVYVSWQHEDLGCWLICFCGHHRKCFLGKLLFDIVWPPRDGPG